MTTKEIKIRPSGIPEKCIRGVCGGTVLYTEELDGNEWKCNLCSHIYVTKEKRLEWVELNYEKILRDVVCKGHRQALALNPVQSTDIKYLKEKYPELYNELQRTKIDQTYIPPEAEAKRELETDKDRILPFTDFLDKITGMDKDVQLRLIDIYEKMS